MADVVRREPEHSRYVLDRGGEVIGLTDYRVVREKIALTHTEIHPALRRQGLGAVMVRGVLDDIRTRTDLAVIPACPFVEDFIGLHEEYQDLLTRTPAADGEPAAPPG